MSKIFPLTRWLATRDNWYRVCRSPFWFVFRLFYGVRIEGVENIPREGAFILAANHISNFDPPLVGSMTPRVLNFMAKIELFQNPVMGNVMFSVQAFPVDRSRADMNAIKEAIRRLKAGKALGIFIEGTRNQGNAEAMNGAAFIAQRAQVPMVPAAISRRGRGFVVRYGRAIEAQGKTKEAMQALTDTTMQEIKLLLEERVLEPA